MKDFLSTNKRKIITAIVVSIVVVFGIIGGLGKDTMLGQSIVGASTNDIFTPYKIEGFGKGWYTQPEFDGADMPDNALTTASNIDFNIKSSIAPRRGTKLTGELSTSTYPIMSMHTSVSMQGRELMLRTYNTVVEWWNEDQEEWETLATGFTAGQSFTFADGNNSSEDQVYTYMANGKDALGRFRVAFGSVASNSSTAVTLNAIGDYDSADDVGFQAGGGTVVISGTEYAYSGLTGWALTGMTGVPVLTVNDGVIENYVTSGFTDAPDSAESLVIKDQRLYAAYSNSVFCSKIDNLTDFSYSAPRVAGEGELAFFPDGGSKINSLAVRPDYVVVFKDNYVGRLEFKDFGADANDIPTIKTLSTGYQVGATNKNAVTTNGFSVLLVNGDIGLAELTRLENKDYDEIIAITEIIRPSVELYDYSDSAIMSDGRYVVYSAKSDGSDFYDKVIVYSSQYRRLSEFNGLNAKSFTVYNGQIYYGSSVSTNVYQMFYNEYNDAGYPYETNWKTKWYNLGEPTRWKEVGWVFVEGFISANTTIKFRINLDDGGALSSKEVEIRGDGNYVSQPVGSTSFGENPFGLVPFSDASGKNELLHFAGYIDARDMTKYKFRNIQFEGFTSGSEQNYRINKIVPFVNILDEAWGRSYRDQYIINN